MIRSETPPDRRWSASQNPHFDYLNSHIVAWKLANAEVQIGKGLLGQKPFYWVYPLKGRRAIKIKKHYGDLMKIKLFQEFKEFAVKGNMIDIAVGVIIGAAFNKVVDVLVKEIFLPPLSFMTDGINLENKRIILRAAVTEDGITKPEEIAIGYGKLIESGLDFLIIGFTVFMIIKLMNTVRKKAEDPDNPVEETPKDIELLTKMTKLMERQVRLLESRKDQDGQWPEESAK
jgi:large conductance mechanosensitive channel